MQISEAKLWAFGGGVRGAPLITGSPVGVPGKLMWSFTDQT
jgi:hypothetical protein